MLATLLQVALGGAIGSSLRYLSNVGAMRLLGPGFPWATLFVNVVGSFVMGVIVEAIAQRGGQAYAPFLMTGILGGFTTFSAFSLDTMVIWERGDHALAVLYVAASVGLSLVAIAVAMHLFRGALS
ncbi:fluoride efflux transporter CrcB [Neotabrizicola shimadae]|uniref:Fluoride-specific ion channel FluC n=1 Tax=Neotabrizicola shimadae TaxID=2807096 RepID=A0A8G1EBX5_9RHOB|nr:fluoride efflux transporter CrcB [Neotabrizicola shimadae]QYZ68591.1 fluoride efflux transporter CrcB [Neotabrizicola shimadae]